jgi:hypothetical protein
VDVTLAAGVLVAGAVALDAPRHIDGREHVDLEVHLGLLSIASFPHGSPAPMTVELRSSRGGCCGGIIPLMFIPAGAGPWHTCVSTGRSPFQPTATATAAAACCYCCWLPADEHRIVLSLAVSSRTLLSKPINLSRHNRCFSDPSDVGVDR